MKRLFLYARGVLQLSLMTLPLLYAPGGPFISQNASTIPIELTPAVQLKLEQDRLKTERTVKLKAFLLERNSPLADSAQAFIDVAMENDLDWRLLPAIACKESGCGQAIPYDGISGQPSYNPFGWGVYDASVLTFPNWESSIQAVAEGISVNYYENGLTTPEQIEAVYTPSSIERGRTWSRGINIFMAQIGAKTK